MIRTGEHRFDFSSEHSVDGDLRDLNSLDIGGQAVVHVYGNGRFFVGGHAVVYFFGDVVVHAFGHATVHLYGGGRVDATQDAKVFTSRDPLVTATGRVRVYAGGTTRVFAYGEADVFPASQKVDVSLNGYARKHTAGGVEGRTRTYRAGYVVLR